MPEFLIQAVAYVVIVLDVISLSIVAWILFPQ